jgi:hypothetical protein
LFTNVLKTFSLSIHFHCQLPFAEYLTLILSSFFSVRKIRDSNVFCIVFHLVNCS